MHEGCHTQGLMNLRWPKQLTLSDDHCDLAKIGNVPCGVAVDQNQIGKLAGCDAASVVQRAAVPGSIQRGDL